MIEDFGGLFINVVSEPTTSEQEPKGQKRKREEHEDDAIGWTFRSPRKKTARNEGRVEESRPTKPFKTASLFRRNPSIPSMKKTPVDRVTEAVFSSKTIQDLPLHPFMRGQKRKREEHVDDATGGTSSNESETKHRSLKKKTARNEGRVEEHSPMKSFKTASLFRRNPSIPSMKKTQVDSVAEAVFSSKTFQDLPLHPFMVSNLLQNMKLEKLTRIQSKGIPIMLKGRDCLIKSQTGSGKTLAYAIPLIQKLQEITPKISRTDGVFALVIVPTRELALQTYEWFQKLVKSFVRIVPGCFLGGERKSNEKARLRKGINVLITTPGRMIDHITNSKSLKLDKVQWLVLDEADRMLDMGYEKDIARIIESLNEQQIEHRQTVMLSATLTTQVESLAGVTLKNPVFIDASKKSTEESESDILVVPENLSQFYILVPPKLRLVTLASFVIWKCKFTKERKMLIFCATQDMVDFHTELLSRILCSTREGNTDQEDEHQDVEAIDIEFFKLHGNMLQKDRTEVFKTFREAESGVLLCTDVAARGLDLPQVDWIVQYTAPSTPTDYVHRVGRTARIGSAGFALLFLTPSEAEFVQELQSKKMRLEEESMENCLQQLAVHGAQGSFSKHMSNTMVESSATALQMKFEQAVTEDKSLYSLACKSYVSFVRSYASYSKEVRHIFNFKSVHLGHHAKSHALRDPPSAIGGIGKRQWEERQSRMQRTNSRRPTKPSAGETHRRKPLDLISEFSSGLEPGKKKKKKF